MGLIGELITVTVPGAPTGGTDDQGNPVLGDDVSTSLRIKAFAPQRSDETAGAPGITVVSSGTVYGFPGTVIPSDAVLTIRGERWHVAGELGEFVSPYAGSHPDARGVEVAVVRAS